MSLEGELALPASPSGARPASPELGKMWRRCQEGERRGVVVQNQQVVFEEGNAEMGKSSL